MLPTLAVAPNPADSANVATMPWRAWYGDEDVSLIFPSGWEVTSLWPQDAPAASPAQIEHAFAHPIGSPRIAELARGKRSAAIVVDDISRPTPASDLVPYVLAELAEASVPQDEIRFVIGGGSHRPQTDEEIVKKLGAEVAARYQVRSHNFTHGDMRGLGNLPDGMPLYFDRVVTDSEFKMTIGGVYPHGSVGFGGGSKLILPGVAGLATMTFFHSYYASRGQGNIENETGVKDHRDVSEEAAAALGLDVVVNAVINSHRQIAGVFVGHYIQAQRAGARFARQVYATHIPDELRRTADVVVYNAYPLDSDPIQTGKALWSRPYFENDPYAVVVNPAVDGICYHGLFDRIDWGRFQRIMAERPPMDAPAPVIQSRDQVLMWSEHFPAAEFPKKWPTGVLFRRWETLIDRLAARLPATARVVVFPCSGVQILARE